MHAELINWAIFTETRDLLGGDLVRILGYFREDGMKSVGAVEAAMRSGDSAQLILPAHTLKGEAWQFGAEPLANLCEEIEMTARHYVEIRQDPSDLVEKAVQLRPLFEESLELLELEVNPLVERRPTRRASLSSHDLG